MNTPAVTLTIVTAMMLTGAQCTFAESATMGWHAVQRGEYNYVERVYMAGPSMRNKTPEKKGVFKGRFFSRNKGIWQANLVAVYKLSLDNKGELQSHKVEFSILPASDATDTEMMKAEFETDVLSFEPGELFLLVFKAKGETEMVVLPISKLFVPS